MAKVTFRGNLFNKLTFKNAIDLNTASQIGGTTLFEIKRATAKGISPVKGLGRFVAYKAQRIGKSKKNASKKGYPYSVQDKYPNKLVRPVNLRLSGKMLDALEYKFHKARQVIEVGIFDAKQSLKAETHNQGTQEPRVPTRQFLPVGSQTFSETIKGKIVRIVKDRILDIIRKAK